MIRSEANVVVVNPVAGLESGSSGPIAEKEATPRVLPLLPLRNTVLFPGLFIPLSVGRPPSVAAIEAALASEEKTFLVAAQRDASLDQPGLADLYTVGVIATIKKVVRTDNTIELIVQGGDRVRLLGVEATEPYLQVRYEPHPLPEDDGLQVEALQRAVVEQAAKIIELAEVDTPVSVQQLMAQSQGPLRFIFVLASMMSMDSAKEQALLEADSRADALSLMHGYLAHEVQVLEVRKTISSKVASELNQQQREIVLRRQMDAIQEELGEKEGEKADMADLRRRLAEADLPAEVRKEAEREMARLERLPQAAPEHQILRSYLELVIELPWNKSTSQTIDLVHAKSVLDEDHFGLEEVKERILEDIAVLKLNPRAKAPILCLVGPPGVGKTSLGQSVARALGRKFERFSLGGLHDEAELRGHRRTYVGAMPGRLIQALRRAGVNNPVLMLDEVDKLGRDHRGDPASALLEVLDPAQNGTFRDNYLDLPFDLSKVLFITTANDLGPIPRPLLDRMEVLRLSGYSEEEKRQIAERYLVPRQIEQTGLTSDLLRIESGALGRIISRYTREAGVRELERSLGRVARKVARKVAEGRTDLTVVEENALPDLLGREKSRPEQARQVLPAGVATGLAWTEAGGDVLYIESALIPRQRGLKLTGQLGKVMKESARTAQSLVLSHAEMLGVDPAKAHKNAVHVHVPAGAVPKDGPSAGVAMVSALASLYTGVPVAADVAMTGEITLSGLVLPVGGVKEKVLAARRAGIRKVVLPRDNEDDLRELPQNVRQEMQVTLAGRIEEALAVTLPGLAGRPTLRVV